MTRYIISKSTAIEVDENNVISPEDLEIALVAALGFEPQDVEGVTVWTNGNERFWLLHQQELPDDATSYQEAAKAITEKTGAQPLAPTQDNGFAQLLMRQMPMNVTGEAFVGGSLAGVWRVETVSQYMPYNVERHGFLTGKQQPVSVSHGSLPLAVSILFLQALGVGQHAYVFIPDGAEAEPQLFYVTVQNEKLLKEVMPETSLFRMEGLDRFAVVGLDADIVKEAIEKAQLQRTILMAKAKTDTPQPEPELVAAAPAHAPKKAE
ncbi:hypothetical protein [Pantoea anthophila]|uniref:hypothetical protein n=1 Tax=Pantoea anthophila TaxID=470931 RepID=UPI000614B915|nr:hypothetical protein [Pantoea anthophila]KKB02652.1 hypothetical protein TN98_20590 [Pantoea anthophila]